MNGKALAIFVAILMISAAGMVGISNSDSVDADATAAGGSVKVYYDAGEDGWKSSVQTAYNLYLAVYGAMSLGYTITTTAANTQWDVDEGGYSNPNMNYGLINEVNNSTTFSIKGYNNTSGEWDDIKNVPLGWLRPFADYSTVTVSGAFSSVYANVAISSTSSDVGCSSLTGMITPTEVQGNSAYLHTFTLMDPNAMVSVPAGTQVKVQTSSGIVSQTITSSDLLNGVTVCGYGSDAYLALRDAVGSGSLVGQMDAWEYHDMGDYGYYTYYSWMDTLFGVGTVSEGSNYHYWSSYDSTMSNYLSWTLGYYSSVHFNATNQMSAFLIMYV